MHSYLPKALVLAGLLIAMPSESIAQRHGASSHGGGWHGGGGRGHQRGYGGGNAGQYGYGGYGYQGYGGYRPYAGYAGYPGYYGYGGYYDHHDHYNDGAWIAIGAGILGVILGAAVSQRHVDHYGYPNEAPPPPPSAPAPTSATPRCQDGSPIPAGGYCQGPPPPVQQPERG